MCDKYPIRLYDLGVTLYGEVLAANLVSDLLQAQNDPKSEGVYVRIHFPYSETAFKAVKCLAGKVIEKIRFDDLSGKYQTPGRITEAWVSGNVIRCDLILTPPKIKPKPKPKMNDLERIEAKLDHIIRNTYGDEALECLDRKLGNA